MQVSSGGAVTRNQQLLRGVSLSRAAKSTIPAIRSLIEGHGLRVLHVTPGYPGPRNPVAGIFVQRLVEQLARHGVHCEVLVFRSSPPALMRRLGNRYWLSAAWRGLRSRGGTSQVPVHEVLYEQMADKGGDDVPRIARALLEWALRNDASSRFDVIAAHWLWPGAAAALGLSRTTHLPLVAFGLGSDLHTLPERREDCRRYVGDVLASADGLLACSEFLLACAERIRPGSSKAFTVFRHGCDPQIFRPAEDRAAIRRSVRLDPDGRYVASCGAVSEAKGAAELAAAWELFAASHERWELLVVGRAVEPDLISRLKRLPRVRVVGQVENVVPYLQSADIYVQPSRREGWCCARIEAMAVGLPVVATEVGGQVELLVHGINGMLVPAQNPSAIATTVASLAANPSQARQLGNAARDTVVSLCNPEQQASRVLDALASVARTRHVDVELLGR